MSKTSCQLGLLRLWKVQFWFFSFYIFFSLLLPFFFISTMQRKQEKPAHFLGAACFDDNSTCSDICPSKQGTILHKVCVRRWFYSSCHKDLRLFLSSFGFVSNLWCTCLYSLLSIGILDNFIAYILLWTTSVDSLTMCASHFSIFQHIITLNHNNFPSLSHIPTIVYLHQSLICDRGCPFSIMSSISLVLFRWSWFFLHVFIFASTCLVLFVDGFSSLFIYIYIYI